MLHRINSGAIVNRILNRKQVIVTGDVDEWERLQQPNANAVPLSLSAVKLDASRL